MDLLAHALYGVTSCSRLGLAGGRNGARLKRWWRESTVWWALFFGLAPDMISMWLPFGIHVLAGPGEHFFRHFGGHWLTVYRVVHSLFAAGAVAAVLWLCCRPLLIASLAWPLHILLDAVTHGSGKFQTLPLYPFSRWGFQGVDWWRYPGLFIAVWLLLPVTWLGLALWRRKWRTNRSRENT